MKNSNNRWKIYVPLFGALLLLLPTCETEPDVVLVEETTSVVPLNLESGYDTNHLTGQPITPLISPTGDTIPTGVSFEVTAKLIDNDSIKPPVVNKAGAAEQNAHEFSLYHYPSQIDTFQIPQDSIQIVNFGDGNPDYIHLTDFGDTILTGVPVTIKPEKIKAKAPKVIKAMPPFYMENCYSDIQSIDVAQGLSSSYIITFYQDGQKNLWYGTAGAGIGKYDGLNFYIYTTDHGLAGNDVREIRGDKDGNIWMYTNEGLSMFDGQSFYNYREKNQFFENIGTQVELDSAGNVWASTTAGGLAKFDGSTFTFITLKEGLSSGAVNDIVASPKGGLWIAYSRGGVSYFDGQKFTNYNKSAGLSSDNVASMACTPDNKLYLSVGNGLIECIDGDQLIKYGNLDGLDLQSIRTLYLGKHDHLWIGTQEGAAVYDGEKIQRFSTLEGQPWRAISAMIEDDAGNIWLGTYGSGMHRIKENSFSMLTEFHGLREAVHFTMFEDSKGNIWFGGREKGLTKFNGKEFITYTEEDGLPGDRIRWITEDNEGRLWIGTNHTGVSAFDGTYFTNYDESNGLCHDVVKCILQDSHGDMWFATFAGLTRFDGEHFYHYTRETGFPIDRVWSIIEDEKGNLWFGTENSGLVKYDGKQFTLLTEKEGLSSNRLRSVLSDDHGNLWIGTKEKGVVKFDGNEFTYFTEQNGLCHDVVMTVAKDQQNNIWVGTDHGLSLIENNKADMKEHSIRNFSYVDGLKALDFNTTSALADSKNNMWLPTGKGVTTINADVVNFEYNDPVVQLNSLNIQGDEVDYRNDKVKFKYRINYDSVAAYYNYPVEPRFHHSTSHISFNYSAIDWSAPHRILYSHKLEGLDKDWSNPTKETKVDYRNLSHGEYTFMVKAKGDNDVWSEPFVYPFQINTPWWETTIAKAFYGVSIIMFIVFIMYLRTRRLRQKQVILERKVAHATKQLQAQYDELGIKNVEIQNQKKEVEKQKEIIEHNHQQITDSIRYSKKIQTSLLLPADKIKDHYSNFFVLFEPKDIVSGDFYFFREFGDIDYISCVDCTGHGVPGGFMSTLSYLLMDKLIQEDKKLPGEIMAELSDALIHTLHQEHPDSIQDGMDMSLCRVDHKNRIISFAGARNGVLIVTKDGVEHHAPDFLPVGGNYVKNGQPIERAFDSKELKIPEGAWVVLYTDGYVEQLGGEDGLPMRSHEYEAMIHKAVQLNDAEKIVEYLSKSLKEWQGNQERIDDICIIGFQI